MIKRNFLILAFALVVFSFAISAAYAQPSGATITFNETVIPDAAPAASITTAGGSFTTLVLNGTFQNQKWKAYVGNVTGILSLDDSSSNTIYDWELVTIAGEVYVSRTNSIDWGTIGCAAESTINAEQSFLSMNSTSIDNINNTFNNTVHKSFYVGTTPISNSTCRSIATYVGDAKQTISENAKFQEVLLDDSSGSLVYTTIIEPSELGYDNDPYDFQMIVPEDDTNVNPNPYYFWVELS